MILAVGLFATRTVTRAADNDVRKLVKQTVTRTTPLALTARSAAGPTHASAGRLEPEPAAGGEHSWLPERLAPQPPAGCRDAPDPVVVHDGDRWALFSTQAGFLIVPEVLGTVITVRARPRRPAVPSALLRRRTG